MGYLDYYNFKIDDFWDDGPYGAGDIDRYFVVDLGDGYSCTVKFPRINQAYGYDLGEEYIDYDSVFSYIIDCETYGDDLNILFDECNKNNNPPELEFTDEEYNDILNFVDDNAKDFVLGNI